MAAAILSIFIMPIIAGFSNAAKNFQFAKKNYEAELYSSNLLIECEAALMQKDPYGLDPSDTPREFILNPNFDFEYKTDLFGYSIDIQEIGKAETVVLKTNEDLEVSGFHAISSSGITTSVFHSGEAILYDGGFRIVSGESATIVDQALTLSIPSNHLKSADILILNSDNPILINVNSQSTDFFRLNIFTAAGVDKNKITLNCTSENNKLLVAYMDYKPRFEYQIMVSVFNRNRELLNLQNLRTIVERSVGGVAR